MSFFQVPPPTPYDLKFTIAGIPVRVHPLFWLLPILFGANTGLTQILIWIIAVFISILIHELGHSFAMRYHGQDSYIVLHIFGGLAVPAGYSRSQPTLLQLAFISFAGPLAGFLFAGIIVILSLVAGGSVGISLLFGFIPIPVSFLPYGAIVNTFVGSFLWVNIFWGLLNLMPVYPLDGGHISRHLFTIADPWRGVQNSLWLSIITGGFLAVMGLLLLNSIYMAFLFGMLTFQSYQILQGSSTRLF